MDTQTVRCPYCGEWLEVFIDASVRQQEYIEDCQVCCRPITLTPMGRPNRPVLFHTDLPECDLGIRQERMLVAGGMSEHQKFQTDLLHVES